MAHNQTSIKVTPGSEKSFGLVFSLVFLIIGLYPLIGNDPIRLWSVFIAIILLGITYLRPELLQKPNYYWFRFGLFLGGIIAPIIMALVYICTVVPIGFLVRLSRKDLLKLKLNPNATSYWIERDTPMQPMKNQF